MCEVKDEVAQLNTKIDDLINQNSNFETILQLILTALGIPAPVISAFMSSFDFNQLSILGVI